MIQKYSNRSDLITVMAYFLFYCSFLSNECWPIFKICIIFHTILLLSFMQTVLGFIWLSINYYYFNSLIGTILFNCMFWCPSGLLLGLRQDKSFILIVTTNRYYNYFIFGFYDPKYFFTRLIKRIIYYVYDLLKGYMKSLAFRMPHYSEGK